MKLLSFELTIPNVGSWNGKWTGSDKKYYIVKSLDNKTSNNIIGEGEPSKNYYYNFGDGWGANIRVERVDSRKGNKRRRRSAGFCGYGWMVDSIIKYGKILTDS